MLGWISKIVSISRIRIDLYHKFKRMLFIY
jgi:hypothetical protein